MKAIPRPNNRLHLIGAVGTDHPPEAAGGGRRLWALGNLVELLREPSAGVAAKPSLTAYPNPATGPFYLVYQVPEGVQQAEVRLHDGQGRLVRQEQLSPKNGIMEVLAKDLASGTHIATLYYDGIQVGSAKVNVLH